MCLQNIFGTQRSSTRARFGRRLSIHQRGGRKLTSQHGRSGNRWSRRHKTRWPRQLATKKCGSHTAGWFGFALASLSSLRMINLRNSLLSVTNGWGVERVGVYSWPGLEESSHGFFQPILCWEYQSRGNSEGVLKSPTTLFFPLYNIPHARPLVFVVLFPWDSSSKCSRRRRTMYSPLKWAILWSESTKVKVHRGFQHAFFETLIDSSCAARIGS